MILIDSSLWILGFKSNGSEEIKKMLGELLDKDLVATCGMILLEILQGSRNKTEYDELAVELDALHYCETNKEVWERSAQLGFDLRRKGLTIPATDILIASVALFYDFMLFHADHHFEMIAKNIPLKSKQIAMGI